MKFKEWYLLSEMPHMKMPQSPVNGVVGDIIDFRREDNRASMSVNWDGVWVAKTKEGWLSHDGNGNLEILPSSLNAKGIQRLPDNWWNFVTIINGNNIVKAPAKARSDYERVTAGGPQSLGKQSSPR